MSAIGSDDEESNTSNSLDSSDKQSVSVEETIANKSTLTILDGKFFKQVSGIQSEKSNLITGTCVKCLPKVVKIKGLAQTTSNFLGHLKRKHGESAVTEYREYFASHRQKMLQC